MSDKEPKPRRANLGLVVILSAAAAHLALPTTASAQPEWGPDGPGADPAKRRERRLPTAFRRGKAREEAPVSSGAKVSFELYVMSKCPYGTRVENTLAQLVAGPMGDHVDLHVDYIMNDSSGQLAALHGATEVEGNIIELCVIKHHPAQRDFMRFVRCQNRSFRSVPTNWKRCARQLSMPTGPLEACFKGSEGKQLARASMHRSRAARATGSPTMVIGGKRHGGGRSLAALTREICSKLPASSPPKACGALPKPIDVELTVLTDRRCKTRQCKRASSTVTNMRNRFFPSLKTRWLDYGSAEGRRLYRDARLKLLPAFLFTAAVKKAERYPSLKRWLKPAGKHLAMRYPAEFDPTAEICDNTIDDTGNGKVDCKDPTCRKQLVCRKQLKGRLDVFVMSRCPFAAKGLLAMREVRQQLGAGLRHFAVHYIADEIKGGGLRSLHGPKEVAGDMRRLCVERLYAPVRQSAKRRDKHLAYLFCRSKSPRGDDWKPCARDVGLSVRRIERCVAKRGERLLRESLQLARALKIRGSPTWLVNNRHRVEAISLTPESLRQAFCKHNAAAPGC